MKCPYCGSFVRAIDTLDSEWYDGAYYDDVEGTCSNCGKSFRWTEVYSFERCEDIELVEEGEHL